MTASSDYDYLLESGCKDVSKSLGIRKMPEGYALMLDADEMFFFWFHRETGRESAIHWSKWVIYNRAKADAEALE